MKKRKNGAVLARNCAKISMQRIRVLRLGFGSFLKLYALRGLSLDGCSRVGRNPIALCDGALSVSFGSTAYTGLAAKIMSAALAPVVCVLLFVVAAAVMHPLLRATLRWCQGTTLTVQVDEKDER